MSRLLTLEDLRGLSGRIALDVETTGGHAPHLGSLVGLGVWCEDSGIIGFIATKNAEELRKIIVETWKPGSWLIAHNLKYEARWLGLTARELKRFNLYDTAVAEHLLNENIMKDLASVETRRLRTKTKRTILDFAKEDGYKISDVSKWPTNLLADYCVNDCRLTYYISREQVTLLRMERLENLFSRLMQYLRIVHGAEQRGMFIDETSIRMLRDKLTSLEKTMDERWKTALREAGVTREVNYNSPQQLSELLYQDLNLPKPAVPDELKNSPKAKKYSSTATGKEILAKLGHPIADMILEIKKLHKIDGYLESYIKLGEPVDGGIVLHPDFNITGTVTGRLSAANPNLQQVPAKPVATKIDPEGVGVDLRKIFHARPGYLLASIDYQQMEAVVFGLLAKDPTMTKLIEEGGDLHKATAKLLFGEYDDRKRKVVKTLNFGLLYGLGRAGLAESLDVSLEESDRLMDDYLDLFPRARPYMEEVAAELRNRGYVRYWSGRKRRIEDRRFHYRGVNAIVQGGCADALAEAVLRVERVLEREGGHLIALIHDELLLEVPKTNYEEVTKKIQEAMSIEDVFGIPLRTDCEIDLMWSS